MQFDNEGFCPNIVDKSTPLKKFLYCTKIKDLCKMVTYFPSGQISPKKNVKETGCPYGYVIQGIEKVNQVTQKNNVLDDTSIEKNNNSHSKQKTNKKKEKNTNKTTKKTNKKTTKKNIKKK